MSGKLYYNTVEPILRDVLLQLMQEKLFAPFRLIGGTSLSLQIGHRKSDDIDLFTDELYGSIEFDTIDKYFKSRYAYVHCDDISPVAFGKMYRIGNNKNDSVKVDLMYSTEKFIRPLVEIDGIRLAPIEEIVAMKVDIVQRGGRKKDFWDLHALMDKFTLDEMIDLHLQRYPFDHDDAAIRKGFSGFKRADQDADPICLRGEYWELIRMDLIQFAQSKK